MKKYTIKTIKQTKCYKSNIDAIKDIYPNHVEDFARELMIAANCEASNFEDFEDFSYAFCWDSSPQGGNAWTDLYNLINGDFYDIK